MLEGKQPFFLVGFVTDSDKEAKTCFETAKKFFENRDCSVYKCDALYPFRMIQDRAYRALGLKSPGDPYEAVGFSINEAFREALFEEFELQLGQVLVENVRRMMRQAWSRPVAIITTDCQNRVYNSMRSIGYSIIRIEPAGAYQLNMKHHEQTVEEDYLVKRSDFKAGASRAVIKPLAKIFRRKNSPKTA